MRISQYFAPTLKETPTEAVTISHQLMLRAGFIHKISAGLYTWLPLGLKTLHKIQAIIQAEMSRIGCIEILMPMVQPASLWEESGRWQKYGTELLRLTDRHKRDFCLAPTHEEVITYLVKGYIKSYKQLPLNLYQIQTKFRDEIRPRFGVMRAREFTMKDGYSFHANYESLSTTYDQMHQAYNNIFRRLGLKTVSVAADAGKIGGSLSHEFHVLADSGEDQIAFSRDGNYAANLELVPAALYNTKLAKPQQKMQLVNTPKLSSIHDVSRHLNIKPSQLVKTLLVVGKKHPIVALVIRGDHTLNATKAVRHSLVAKPLTMASQKNIAERMGVPIGFIGPVDLTIPIIVDFAAAVISDFTCGANKLDYHFSFVNWHRDCPLESTADLRNITAGETHLNGSSPLDIKHGIEVGHIFQLGDKYTKVMNMSITDHNGRPFTPLMGCYGIGVSRIIAAAIEQRSDGKNINLPQAILPFTVALVVINNKNPETNTDITQKANNIYADLQQAQIDVLFFDQPERAGVIFAKIELLGIVHRIVINNTSIIDNNFEYKNNITGKIDKISCDQLITFLIDQLAVNL